MKKNIIKNSQPKKDKYKARKNPNTLPNAS